MSGIEQDIETQNQCSGPTHDDIIVN